MPNWPKLMSLELAASYFSISPNTFRGLGIVPIEIGRRVLYDRESLDIYAAQLAGQPLSGDEIARAQSDEERAFFRDRGKRDRG